MATLSPSNALIVKMRSHADALELGNLVPGVCKTLREAAAMLEHKDIVIGHQRALLALARTGDMIERVQERQRCKAIVEREMQLIADPADTKYLTATNEKAIRLMLEAIDAS